MYKKDYFIKFLSKCTITERRNLQILQEVQFFFNKIKITKKPSQDHFLQYKEYLLKNFKYSSYCFKLSCLNKYRAFLKMQKFNYSYNKPSFSSSDILTFSDYRKLLKNTEIKKHILILQTFFLTGIRFSELEKLTVESLNDSFSFFNKKAFRKIPLHKALKKDLKLYCAKNNIITGAVFLSRYQNPISYTAIRNLLKQIARNSKVKMSKVTKTHNFRRLFITYASQYFTIRELQEIVGHKDINTTSKYIPVDELNVIKILNKKFLYDKKATTY
jgi:integrase